MCIYGGVTQCSPGKAMCVCVCVCVCVEMEKACLQGAAAMTLIHQTNQTRATWNSINAHTHTHTPSVQKPTAFPDSIHNSNSITFLVKLDSKMSHT